MALTPAFALRSAARISRSATGGERTFCGLRAMECQVLLDESRTPHEKTKQFPNGLTGRNGRALRRQRRAPPGSGRFQRKVLITTNVTRRPRISAGDGWKTRFLCSPATVPETWCARP